jgi:acetyl-CoA synthetase
LRSFVRDRLAAYQYPRAITFVDALPMTPSGKIDRGSLRLRTEREAARGGQQRGS